MTPASILLKVTVVLALALVGTRLARRTRASVRHVVLSAAFAILLALPLAAAFAPAINVPLPISTTELPAPVIDAFAEAPRTAEAVDAGVSDVAVLGASAPMSWSSIALTAWLCGAALFLLPVGIGLRQMRTLRRDGLPWLAGQRVVDELAAAMGIRHRVSVLLHESISGPMTCGVVRSIILLPADADTWPAHELQAAIIHELEHVRRGDWVSQCLARTVAAAYWFHPMVWIAWRHLALEAERACDDAVLKHADATIYADQLVVLARRLSTATHQPQLAMANRRDLSERVLAVLDSAQRRGRAGVPWIIAASAAAMVVLLSVSPIRIIATVIADQSAPATGPKPKYDAATIKPCVAEENPTGARGTAGGTNASATPGRFFVPCVTTEQLIYLAYASYGVPEDQHLANDDAGSASNDRKIRGGPSWVHSLKEKYQIEATAQGVTERTVLMGTMLQSLLEDRFRLKMHRDTEEVPMLVLRVGKGGVKLTPMKDGDCEPYDPATGPMPGAKPTCGMLNMGGSPSTIRWTFSGFALSSLASQLSRTFGMHVIDKTAVADKFIYTFEFARGEDPLAMESSARSSVEALGLTLENTKAPRGFIVIDSIERPSANETLFSPARIGGPRVERAAQVTGSRFAVASIKPCQGSGLSSAPTGGREASQNAPSQNTITVNCQTLVEILARAYMQFGNPPPLNVLNVMDPENVSGGPNWARSERYSIEAKADGTPGTGVMMGAMLRTLLEDRFELKVHEAFREVPAFALTVASGGLKVKPVDPSTCEAMNPYVPVGRPAPGDKPRCTTGIVFNGPNMQFKSVGQTFDRVSQGLGAMLLGRAVVNQTGAEGLYTFAADFAKDESLAALHIADSSQVSTAPNIFTVFEQQLGLKFVPSKARQGYLVIDRAARPSPNMPAVAAGGR